MITNAVQLEGVLEYMATLQRMQEAMRVHLQETDPSFFPTVSEGYTTRIGELQTEIIEYLRERPSESALSVRLAGPTMQTGVIRASLISNLITGFQSALYQVGRHVGSSEEVPEGQEQKIEGIRSVLGLNLLATAPGSFILAMDLPGHHQPTLFEEYDTASAVLEQLIDHVNELRGSPAQYTGDRPTLRGLQKVSTLVKREVETIEVDFHDEHRHVQTVFDPVVRERIEYLLGAPKEGERTIQGTLIEINIKTNTCKVEPEGEREVIADYDEGLEDDLIAGVKQRIEMAGQFTETGTSGSYRITKIERFRLLDTEDEE